MSMSSFLFGSTSNQESDAIEQVNQLSRQIERLNIPGFHLRQVSSVVEIDVEEVKRARERIIAHQAAINSIQVR